MAPDHRWHPLAAPAIPTATSIATSIATSCGREQCIGEDVAQAAEKVVSLACERGQLLLLSCFPPERDLGLLDRPQRSRLGLKHSPLTPHPTASQPHPSALSLSAPSLSPFPQPHPSTPPLSPTLQPHLSARTLNLIPQPHLSAPLFNPTSQPTPSTPSLSPTSPLSPFPLSPFPLSPFPQPHPSTPPLSPTLQPHLSAHTLNPIPQSHLSAPPPQLERCPVSLESPPADAPPAVGRAQAGPAA